MVEVLARAGVPTTVVARRADRLSALAERLPGVEVLVADLTDAEGLASVERVAGTFDLVVNNAGFGTSGEFRTLDPDRLEREIALNVTALTRISNAALQSMVERGRGHLMNVSSVASFQCAPRLAVYSATKAYVTSLTESLHEEARGTGVKVTALCPGLTRTEFQSVSNTDGYATRYPRFAWTSAEMVARVGLRDVARGKCLSVPGGVYKALVAVSNVAPRSFTRRLVATIQP